MTDTRTIIPIPTPLTPLVGRESELRDLMALLAGPSRLVTLTGIGGIGKTRLSLQVALEMEPSFENGVLMVPLAAHRDTDAMLLEIVRKLGHNAPAADVDSVADALGPGPRLLLLDNLEQIPDAGPVLEQLLARHPEVTILATSQVPLQIIGERVYALAGMPVAEDEADLRDSAPVQLFIQRAQAADVQMVLSDDDIRTIGEICTQLEGIPLAIELAAARSMVLPPEALLGQLSRRFEVLRGGRSHVPERLRTMRNAIAWSYELLDADEQRLFRYLSVYEGGISIDAVEHTLTTLEMTLSSWEALESFVGRNILKRIQAGESPRYQMLRTLRDFGEEELAAYGEESAARLAHSRFFYALSEQVEAHMVESDQAKWVEHIDIDLENVLGAANWSARHRPDIAVGIVSAAIKPFEFLAVFPRALPIVMTALEQNLNTDALAKGWSALGFMQSYLRKDASGAKAALEKGKAYATDANNHAMLARSVSGLGLLALQASELDEAQRHYQETKELNRISGNMNGMFVTLSNLAIIQAYRGESEDALHIFLEADRIAEETGNLANLSRSNANLAEMANMLNDPAGARDYARKALAAADKLSSDSDRFNALYMLAKASHTLGELDEAESYIHRAVPLARTAGRKAHELDLRIVLVDVLLARDDRGAANREILAILRESEGMENAAAVTDATGRLLTYAHRYVKSPALLALFHGFEHWQSQTPAASQAPLVPASLAARDELEAGLDVQDSASTDAHPSAWSLSEFQRASEKLTMSLSTKLSVPVAVPIPEPVAETPEFTLTPREVDVLRAVADGKSNTDIAAEMFISPRTISTHVSNILTKLEVNSRTAAVSIAMKNNLI